MMRGEYWWWALLFWAWFLVGDAKSYVIKPKHWEYKGHDIGYEVSHQIIEDETPANTLPSTASPKDPVLLLNGFGVGSFHQHRLIPRLLEHQDRLIYGLDYLGQGRSWPKDCNDGDSENEKGLIYSAEMWLDQIITFLEDVVLQENQKVHLVGNSVGGHLAVHVAFVRPDLVTSICLLNPTPVWGLNLPFWSGHLPAPAIPKKIGRYLFDKIRDLTTIEKYLETAYARREAFDQQLMNDIRGCTLGQGGHAAFASIMWSPPLKKSKLVNASFEQCLARLDCDVLLIFGEDDPWCKPAFAKKMLQALDKRQLDKVHRYIELTETGHCPGHEAPQAVASVLTKWLDADDKSPGALTLVKGRQVTHEPWGDVVMEEKQGDDIPVSFVDKLATTFL